MLPPADDSLLTRRDTLGCLGTLAAPLVGCAAEPAALKVEMTPVVRMLSPRVRQALAQLHLRQAMTAANCLMHTDDQGFRGDTGPVERAAFERHTVCRGSRAGGNYQHHAQLAKFKNRYFVAWSNGFADEEAPGQQILVASSDDGAKWSVPEPAVPRAEKNLVHNSVGLTARGDELFLFCWSETVIRDAAAPGMRRADAASKRVALYSSPDGTTWTRRVEKLLDPGRDHCPVFEAPRPAGGAAWLCGGSSSGPVVFRWGDGDLTKRPDTVRVPPAAGAVLPYGETTWYRARDGLLVMFWRDEAQSLRLFVNCSADGGATWTAPVPSDIPNSMQRVSAGNLPDGRAFLVGDANGRLLDRRQLTLALSTDGRTFDRLYMLVDDPTRQRAPGLLKADGWQYPSALADGDRLLVAYSVNKEDIECGVVGLGTLA